MDDPFKPKHPLKCFIVLVVFLLMVLMVAPPALAHGTKGHTGNEFTALQAIKKGIELYDKLVSSGKIEESWEMDLKNIEVFPRQSKEKREFVLKFSRSKGNPHSVYIFFNEKGEYSGSYFTGN